VSEATAGLTLPLAYLASQTLVKESRVNPAAAWGVRGFSEKHVGVVAEGNKIVPGTIDLVALGNLFAASFDGNVNLTVQGNFTVSGGTKSAAVRFPDGGHRQLYCMESPESWFEDFGFGELVQGQAQVRLDPAFSSVVTGDPYHVFITEYEDNNALYVSCRTGKVFVVRAKGSKANGVQLSSGRQAERQRRASLRESIVAEGECSAVRAHKP
jgi:hypothetical protein